MQPINMTGVNLYAYSCVTCVIYVVKEVTPVIDHAHPPPPPPFGQSMGVECKRNSVWAT